MFYNECWYDSGINQFVQADTLIPNLLNSLDWNRYAYARYNPLRYTDPSGHLACIDGEQCHQPHFFIPLTDMAKKLIAFAKSIDMSPEKVIGIGLGHEMYSDNKEEQKIHLGLYRNGFLGYAQQECHGHPTYNCMLNYFAHYESVKNQFLNSDYFGKKEDYLWAQYKDDNGNSNLGSGKQASVELGMEFMLGSKSTGSSSFMDAAPGSLFDPNLASNSGVVDAQVLVKYLHGYPTSDQGFIVVKRVSCPHTGAAGFTLYYNLLGQWTLQNAGIAAC